jgi:hypothetical protein
VLASSPPLLLISNTITSIRAGEPPPTEKVAPDSELELKSWDRAAGELKRIRAEQPQTRNLFDAKNA